MIIFQDNLYNARFNQKRAFIYLNYLKCKLTLSCEILYNTQPFLIHKPFWIKNILNNHRFVA